MNALIRSSILLAVVMSANATFASEVAVRLTDGEVSKVCRDICGKIWATDQVVQEDDHALVFATSDLHDVDGYCFGTSHTLDVKRGQDGWRVERQEEATTASFQPCAEINAKSFSDVNGKISEAKVAVGLKIVETISKGVRGIPVTFSTPELSGFVDSRLVTHLYAISDHPPQGLEFEFAIKGLMPRVLSMTLKFENDRVTSAVVNLLNGFDVVKDSSAKVAQ